MTSAHTFALSLSIAFAVLGLAHFAVWRAWRVACWGGFAATCLLGAVFYLTESSMPALSVRPHPLASALGFLVILVGWLSVASYLGVRRHTLWRLATLLSVFTVAIVALVAADQLTRLQMFSSYAAAALVVVGTAWWSGDRERRESRAVVLTAVLLYPLFVGLAATGLLSMTYIRYAMAMPMLLLGTSMLVEGTLIAQRRAHAAAEAAVDAQRQLQRVVQALAEGSGQVAATGKTLSDGTQLLAMRTDEQTSHIRETAGAVRGVVEQVQLTSGHVAAVDAECQRLEAQARHGATEVQDTVEAIQRIEQRSQEMSEALVLIEQVAFQTNLLALNAAIEAARAGAAGRGFAVVAAEVRALSHRTSGSAGQVRTLIERARSQSAEGVSKVQGVRSTLDAMTRSVQDVAARMTEVSADAAQQRASLDGILSHLDALTRLTDANATMVAQSVMTSDEMNESARHLIEVVAQVQPGPAAPLAVSASPTPSVARNATEAASVEYF